MLIYVDSFPLYGDPFNFGRGGINSVPVFMLMTLFQSGIFTRRFKKIIIIIIMTWDAGWKSAPVLLLNSNEVVDKMADPSNTKLPEPPFGVHLAGLYCSLSSHENG